MLRQKLRRLLSRVPPIYVFCELVELVRLRLVYPKGTAISAILLCPSNGGLAVDIGANRGQSALAIGKLKPGFEILSFEPSRSCLLGLRFTRLLLGRRFRFEMIGVSDATTELTYYEPIFRHLRVPAEGTFQKEHLDKEVERRIGGRFSARECTVQVRSLDEMMLSPDFIKIDVQGLELAVLRGARKTLEKYHPVLVVERSASNEVATIEFLRSLGYRQLTEDDLVAKGISPVSLAGDNVFAFQAA
jgi:FkbM family methyltransferase